MKAIDALISAFAPQKGLKRMAARIQMNAMRQHTMDYNAASSGHRTNGWRPKASGAVSEVSRARNRLRFVGRDLIRNNAIAARAQKVMVQNIVGRGILPNTICESKDREKKVESLLKAHFDTPACDYNGQLDLYGLQAQVVATVASDGEVFVVKHVPRKVPNDVLPLKLQILESDFLDTTKQSLLRDGGESFIVNGIEFDAAGRRVAYWFFDQHPGDNIRPSKARSTRFEADRVAHVYRVDRPGQINGVSWFAPVAVKLADLSEFSDARLYREKIAGCFTAFVHSSSDAGFGVGTKKTDTDTSFTLEELTPGIVERLPDGDEITFGSPPQTEGYREYWVANALEISMGLGISYAALTGDMSMGNFSSNRMGWLEDQRFYEGQRAQMLNPMLLFRIGEWTQQAVAFVDAGAPFTLSWTAPARDMVDPGRDMKAKISAIEAKIYSRSHVQKEMGFDPADEDAEIEASEQRAQLMESNDDDAQAN